MDIVFPWLSSSFLDESGWKIIVSEKNFLHLVVIISKNPIVWKADRSSNVLVLLLFYFLKWIWKSSTEWIEYQSNGIINVFLPSSILQREKWSSSKSADIRWQSSIPLEVQFVDQPNSVQVGSIVLSQCCKKNLWM